MDNKRIGAFIAQLRKEKGMTQKELAEQLNVSDKAVSKWETGKGAPDTAILLPLSRALGVSVGELLSGERLGENAAQQTDRVILEALARSGRTVLTTGLVLLALFGTVLTLSPFYVIGKSYWAAGVILLFCSVLLWLRLRGASRLMEPCTAAFLVLALALQAIPGGAVLVFAPGPEERVVEVFSCFSLTPLGYANFAPFLTSLLTVFLIMFWPFAQARSNAGRTMSTCLVIAVVFSVIPALLFGREYMTSQSWAITASLASAAILWLCRKVR